MVDIVQHSNANGWAGALRDDLSNEDLFRVLIEPEKGSKPDASSEDIWCATVQLNVLRYEHRAFNISV